MKLREETNGGLRQRISKSDNNLLFKKQDVGNEETYESAQGNE